MTRYPQAILVSCEIPWDENEQFMEEVFRREVQMVLQDFSHLYIFGTAGEGYAIDTRRFEDIVRVFYEETRSPDVYPMVGVIALSTANYVERLAFAYETGFRVFQISMPAWGALNDREVMNFFQDVCGTFPDAQFLHYNLPRTKRVLEGPDYRRLIDAVPNLVATKNTGGGLERASGLMKHAGELQHFFGESNFPHGCMYGECSLLASFGPMSPAKTKALFEAGRTGDLVSLFELQKEFHEMMHSVLGPVLAEGRIDGSPGVIEQLVEEAGADRVIYGSDMPLMDPRPQLGKIVTAQISAAAKRAILGENALRLLRLGFNRRSNE